MRRSDGTGTENNSLACKRFFSAVFAGELNTFCDFAFKQDFFNSRQGHNSQVVTVLNRIQISPCGRATFSALHGHVHRAKTFLLCAVVIERFCITRLFARFNESGIKGVLHLVAIICSQRAVFSAVGVGTFVPVFSTFKIGQTMLIIPLLSTVLCPFIKVTGMAPYVHHTVY